MGEMRDRLAEVARVIVEQRLSGDAAVKVQTAAWRDMPQQIYDDAWGDVDPRPIVERVIDAIEDEDAGGEG